MDWLVAAVRAAELDAREARCDGRASQVLQPWSPSEATLSGAIWLGSALRMYLVLGGDCRPSGGGEHHHGSSVLPNVRANRPAEASAVSLVRDDAPCAADQAYGACRSGSG